MAQVVKAEIGDARLPVGVDVLAVGSARPVFSLVKTKSDRRALDRSSSTAHEAIDGHKPALT